MKRIIIIAFMAGVASSFIGGTMGVIMSSPYTEERTEVVFVYATLTNPLIRTYACWCKTPLKPAELHGYTKGIRNVIPATSGSVKGGLIAVSKKELARLDRYEDIPHQYRRERVVVGKLTAWIYIKND